MKLSLDALKERAGAVATSDLLATISGGTDNACHDDDKTTKLTGILEVDAKLIPSTPQPVLNIGTLKDPK